MNRILILGLALGIAGMGLFAAWAIRAGSQFGGGWGDLTPILPFVIGGLVVVGGLTGVLMWLAFYSSRKGYDEPYDLDEPDSDASRPPR